MSYWSLCLLALSFLLVACGGNDTQATAEDVSALCFSYCEKASSCDPNQPLSDEDKTECTEACAKPSQVIADATCLGVYADMILCALTLSCDDIMMGNQEFECTPQDVPERCMEESESTNSANGP